MAPKKHALNGGEVIEECGLVHLKVCEGAAWRHARPPVVVEFRQHGEVGGQALAGRGRGDDDDVELSPVGGLHHGVELGAGSRGADLLLERGYLAESTGAKHPLDVRSLVVERLLLGAHPQVDRCPLPRCHLLAVLRPRSANGAMRWFYTNMGDTLEGSARPGIGFR